MGLFASNIKEWHFTCPSRETPLEPGAKKDGCFRRLVFLGKKKIMYKLNESHLINHLNGGEISVYYTGCFRLLSILHEIFAKLVVSLDLICLLENRH